MVCTECDRPIVAQGYCTMHYQRWRKHGDPTVVLRGREGSRKYTLNQGYFDNVHSPEQAYWLGFITADGGIVRNAKTYALKVELAERDREHVQLLADALGSNKPLRTRSDRGSVGITIDSRRVVASLEYLGVTQRKSAIIQPWKGTDELMPHYWRGLFDGDGSIYRDKYWHMKICGSIHCVRGFADWARDICGSSAKIMPSKRDSDCWQWTVNGSVMSRLLAQALYMPNAKALARKRLLAEEVMS